jgi:hypothetical protein
VARAGGQALFPARFQLIATATGYLFGHVWANPDEQRASIDRTTESQFPQRATGALYWLSHAARSSDSRSGASPTPSIG